MKISCWNVDPTTSTLILIVPRTSYCSSPSGSIFEHLINLSLNYIERHWASIAKILAAKNLAIDAEKIFALRNTTAESVSQGGRQD